MNINFTRIDEIELKVPTVRYEITLNNKTYECFYKDHQNVRDRYEGENHVYNFYSLKTYFENISLKDILYLRNHETIDGRWIKTDKESPIIVESMYLEYQKLTYQRISVNIETLFGSKMHEIIIKKN